MPGDDTLFRRSFLRSGACGIGVLGAGCLGRTGNRGVRSNDDRLVDLRPALDPELVLTFEETFDGDTLDKSKWRTRYPWGAREHNYNGYTSSNNVAIEDGTLVIKAEERAQNGNDYTTGTVSPRQTFSTGYIEGVVKVPPAVSGFWPAFWLTSVSEWPPEIDIFEFFGEDDRAWMTYHYRNDSGDYQRSRSSYGGMEFSEGFHLFSVDWTPERIVWFIDGTERFRYSGDHVDTDDMWLILNFGIDPSFLDSPPSDALPATFEISSLRVWEHKDASETSDAGPETANGTENEGSGNSSIR